MWRCGSRRAVRRGRLLSKSGRLKRGQDATLSVEERSKRNGIGAASSPRSKISGKTPELSAEAPPSDEGEKSGTILIFNKELIRR